ncbi:unnamed protein product, partial [Rotaria sordida]
ILSFGSEYTWGYNTANVLILVVLKTPPSISVIVRRTNKNETNQSEKAISTRKGEFKTGFERDGQICEQAMLVKKTVGIRYLVFLISKMDDSTVN